MKHAVQPDHHLPTRSHEDQVDTQDLLTVRERDHLYDTHLSCNIDTGRTDLSDDIKRDSVHVISSLIDHLEDTVSKLSDVEVGTRRISASLIKNARNLCAMRRRAGLLVTGLFNEPAWDMLLELFIAGTEGRKMPVKNVCLSARTSMSTAIRRLDCLVEAGLAQRIDDKGDARRCLIELTDHGWSVMTTLLKPVAGLSSSNPRF